MQARRAVLGFALGLLTVEMRCFCERMAQQLVDTCSLQAPAKTCDHGSRHINDCESCQAHSHGWRDAIKEATVKRPINSDRINGNDASVAPAHCAVCKQNVNKAPEPGAEVFIFGKTRGTLMSWPTRSSAKKDDLWQGKVKHFALGPGGCPTEKEVRVRVRLRFRVRLRVRLGGEGGVRLRLRLSLKVEGGGWAQLQPH